MGDQDQKLAMVDREQASLGKKLEDLEQADEFLREAQNNAMTKAQGIEDAEKTIIINIGNLESNLDQFKKDQDDIYLNTKEDLKDREQDISDKLDELEKNQENLKNDFDELKRD